MARPPFEPEQTHVSGRRWIAHALDGGLFGFIAAILLIPFAMLSDVAILVYFVVATTAGVVAYFTLAHGRSGRSLGKRICGIRVVDGAGEPPSRVALFKRSLPFVVDFTQLVAFFSMHSSDYRQRLGDRWAGTYVIDAMPKERRERRAPASVRKEDGRCADCGTKVPAGTSVCPGCGKVSLS